MAKDYPNKKHIGLTKEQAESLAGASIIRKKSETFLIREYIETGSNADIQSYKDAHQGE